MAQKIWNRGEETTAEYDWRTTKREQTLMGATMSFVEYFINLGDTKETADQKVSEVSTEVAVYLYVYTLGNVTPLINSINSSSLVFMDAEAKAFLISKLTVS